MTLRQVDGRWLCRKSKKAKTEEDVTDIIVFDGDFCVLMGKAGRTEFHAYLHRSGNKWLQMYGVTSLLGYWGEKDKLVQWAVDKAVDSIPVPEPQKDWETDEIRATRSEYERWLKEARTAHKRSLNEASALGTDVHAEVEAYIKKAIGYGGKLHGVIDTDCSEQCQLFQKWAIENDVTFLASEKVVYSKRLWTAGTLDFLCIINGKLTVGDVKTSNWISPKHFLQCGAYASFYEERESIHSFPDDHTYVREWPTMIQGIVIVQLPRSGGIKVVTNTQVGMTVDNLKTGFERVVELVKADKLMSSNLYN